MARKKKENQSSTMKTMVAILLIILVVPVATIGLLYTVNESFSMAFNRVMSDAPGGIGEYFSELPTREEKKNQIKTIATYNLDLPVSRAAEKLTLLNKESSSVYDLVVREMLRTNPRKTELILASIRDASGSSDVLSKTVSEIEKEKNDAAKADAQYLQALPLSSAVKEINKRIGESINGHSNVAAVINLMDEESASRILSALSEKDELMVLNYLPESKLKAIRISQSKLERRQGELKNLASIYQAKSANALVLELGDTKKYSESELVEIYRNLGPKKAGEVLAKVQDDAFVFGIIEEIKQSEILKNGQDNMTQDILKSIKVYKAYDDNVKELVEIYNNMSTSKIAELLKNMLINSSPNRVYELSNGETITISDEDLAIRILSNFSNSQIGEVLSYLDNTLASDLTRKLTYPN